MTEIEKCKNDIIYFAENFKEGKLEKWQEEFLRNCKMNRKDEIDKLIEHNLILEFEQDLAFKESTGISVFDYITKSNTFSSFRNNEFRRLKLRQLRGYDE